MRNPASTVGGRSRVAHPVPDADQCSYYNRSRSAAISRRRSRPNLRKKRHFRSTEGGGGAAQNDADACEMVESWPVDEKVVALVGLEAVGDGIAALEGAAAPCQARHLVESDAVLRRGGGMDRDRRSLMAVPNMDRGIATRC